MGFISKISYLRLVFWVFFPFWAFSIGEGTTFAPVPLESQVRSAEGVVWGKFKGATSKKVSGVILTEAVFELLAVSGLEPSAIVNKRDNFKIVYPGGSWQGITFKTLGTPEFQKGEEVVLFVRKGRHGFELVNLGMSKYLVERKPKRYGDGVEEIFFKNSIFTSHYQLGRISFDQLNDLLQDRFNQPFIQVVQDKYPYPKSRLSKLYIDKNGGASLERGSRKPASEDFLTKENHQIQKNSPQGIVWIILIFSILGGYFVMVKRSE